MAFWGSRNLGNPDPPRDGEGDRPEDGGGGTRTRAGGEPPPSALRAATSPSRGGSIASPPARDRKLKRGEATELKLPAIREPQKATLVDHVPAGSNWLYEMKYDGYRCLLAVGGGKAKVYTRSGLDWSAKFPEIAAAAAELEIGNGLFDGEIVSLDSEGRTSFSALQAAISGGGTGLSCFLFDALEIDGEDLTQLPNIDRKQRLASVIG